jgi:hypothetical protein
MARKPKSDWDFIRERVTLEALKRFNDDAKRAILDLLRSNVPLSAAFRELFADELEKYFLFPPSPHQRRKEKRQLQASILESHIERTMDSERCSRSEAMKRVAELFASEWFTSDGLADMRLKSTSNSDAVEALKQRLKRAKRQRG